MEDSPINEMYFIFCQKIEKRVKVSIDQISIIHSSEKKEEKTISDNNIYTLYKIVLSKDYKGKPFTLTLIDDKAECYMSYIYSKKNEKIKFKYDLTFEPIYASSPNNLKQEILPFDTQFQIFYEYLKNNNDDKNNNDIYTLFLDSIDYLADNKSICLEQKQALNTSAKRSYSIDGAYIILNHPTPTKQVPDTLLYKDGIIYNAMVCQTTDSIKLHQGIGPYSGTPYPTGTMTVFTYEDVAKESVPDSVIGYVFQHYYMPINYRRVSESQGQDK